MSIITIALQSIYVKDFGGNFKGTEVLEPVYPKGVENIPNLVLKYPEGCLDCGAGLVLEL